MIVLAIDTALDACSAAILQDDDVLWAERRIIGKGHSEALPPMVASGLAAAGVNPAAFDRVGVVIGPGAFAGVRVGLAFARAFRLGLKADVVGVSTTHALAASLGPHAGPTAIVFDARRGQVYAAVYDAALTEVVPPFVARPSEATAKIEEAAPEGVLRFAGSGAALISHDSRSMVDSTLHADPVAVARLAKAMAPVSAPPAPLYLRPPDAAPAAASPLAGLFRS
ncbi:MAG: tRNA (adenosine(37)-N6)-threonylcarbamoyltransferase complex dimerization subunit type 1 TsaB [Parvularculaceae bacterium]